MEEIFEIRSCREILISKSSYTEGMRDIEHLCLICTLQCSNRCLVLVAESLPTRGMVSTQSATVGGGRKLVPSLQQQQHHLAAVSSHVEKPSNLTELLLGITFSIIAVPLIH